MKKELDMNNFISDMKNIDTKATEKEIKMISVYDIEPNEKNFYSMDEKEIEKLAALIEIQGGIREPLILKPAENNKYKIISGHRRQKAMIILLAAGSEVIKEPYVPCLIRNYTEQEEILELVAANSQRKKTVEDEETEIKVLEPVAREAFKAAKKAGEKGKFRKFFAEKILGISESKLQRTKSLEKLDQDIKNRLHKGEISRNTAEKLAKIPKKKQKDVLEKAQVNKKDTNITAKDIDIAKNETSHKNEKKVLDTKKDVQVEHKNELVPDVKVKNKILEEILNEFKTKQAIAKDDYTVTATEEGKFLVDFWDKLIKIVEDMHS